MCYNIDVGNNTSGGLHQILEISATTVVKILETGEDLANDENHESSHT